MLVQQYADRVTAPSPGKPASPKGPHVSNCTCSNGTAATGFDAAAMEAVLAEHASLAGPLMPVLQATQDAFGYLPAPALEAIAAALKLPLAEVLGVATFYARFHLDPPGRHVVQVCHGTACHVKGATEVTDAIVSELGVEVGQTAADLSVAVESVSCVGCCALAPVVLIDEVAHGKQDAKSARRLAKALRVKAAT